MFTLLMLTVLILVLAAITIIAISLGGSVFLVVFGDLIVFVLIITWFIKKLLKKR